MGLMYVINVAVSFWGLGIVNIPLFTCIRRTTPLFVLVLEFLVLGRRPRPQVL
jgi:hypothetical protein